MAEGGGPGPYRRRGRRLSLPSVPLLSLLPSLSDRSGGAHVTLKREVSPPRRILVLGAPGECTANGARVTSADGCGVDEPAGDADSRRVGR